MATSENPAASDDAIEPVSGQLERRAEVALRGALAAAGAEVPESIDPVVRRSDFADFQVNGSLALAKRNGLNPRQLGDKARELMPADDVIRDAEVSGPGFVNVNVTDSVLLRQVARRNRDQRLGMPVELDETIVIDYSQPNIAKEMHVGHIRSTVIGDALARVLGHMGANVIRHNHLGDWGTQFGMLIQYLDETAGSHVPDSAEELNKLYRDSRALFDSDEGFKERARRRVVALQGGDQPTVDKWKEIVAVSQRYFQQIYERLGVLLQPEDNVGESFYNPFLADVVEEMLRLGIAEESQGAIVVFSQTERTPDDKPVPLIIRKADGGYGYATTDLAAIRYRVRELGAKRILYVVDARQAQHFKMVFEAAGRAGWLGDATATHVAYGTVMRPDGKPFKTREGETARLSDLLDSAVDAAEKALGERAALLEPDEKARQTRMVGIGALKYADLSTTRVKNYVFNPDEMVQVNGDTGVYLQYAHARIRSILSQAPDFDVAQDPDYDATLEDPERKLALQLDAFTAALEATDEDLAPSELAGYLSQLARTFTGFYEKCSVLKAPDASTRLIRLHLCALTAETLEQGLNLLGIEAPNSLGVAQQQS